MPETERTCNKEKIQLKAICMDYLTQCVCDNRLMSESKFKFCNRCNKEKQLSFQKTKLKESAQNVRIKKEWQIRQT